MKYKGFCLWADDVPDANFPHYIVIVSEKNTIGNAFVVAISSVKYKDNGQEKYYDNACVLSENDILDETGKPLLRKKSFVRYQYACEMNVDDILLKQLSGHYKYKCKISDALLKRIQDGAKCSLELELRFKKYFDLF